MTLHFQEPGQLSIAGGYVTITERMLMVGFRFPFTGIARELLVQLGVALYQVKPNGWRYLFTSFILWRIKLQKRMSVAEFHTIYRAGTVEFTVRKKPSFIHLAWRYSNNKEWNEQIFSLRPMGKNRALNPPEPKGTPGLGPHESRGS